MSARQLGKCFLFGVAFTGALFLFAASARAAMEFTLDSIDGNPGEINYDQSIELLYSFRNVSGTKTYYLSGVFQKEAGSSYFSFTWNDNWFKYGDDFTNFPKIEITESSISGKLKIKPDIDSSGFKGSGDYLLKIFRYCSSQSACGETNTLSLKIIAPPSSTPTPSPTPTPTPTPTSTPTSSPSPSPTTPSPKASPKNSPSPSTALGADGPTASVSGISEVLGASSSSQSAASSTRSLAWILIGLGGTLIAVSGAVFGYNQFYAAKFKV